MASYLNWNIAHAKGRERPYGIRTEQMYIVCKLEGSWPLWWLHKPHRQMREFVGCVKGVSGVDVHSVRKC